MIVLMALAVFYGWLATIYRGWERYAWLALATFAAIQAGVQ